MRAKIIFSRIIQRLLQMQAANTIYTIMEWILFPMLLQYCAMASNIASDLTVLDESINIGTVCDIVHVHELVVHAERERICINRVTYSTTLNGIKDMTKEMFSFSKCLIMVVSDIAPTSEVIKIGKRLQSFKPLAVFQYLTNGLNEFEKLDDLPFAVILHHGTGES